MGLEYEVAERLNEMLGIFMVGNGTDAEINGIVMQLESLFKSR